MTLQFIARDRLLSLLNYSPETGQFIWRMARRKCAPGATAGSVSWAGYTIIYLDGRKYRAHRLAWLIVHGEWPNGEIDHINGDPGDNRIANLRLATRSQNMSNTAAYRNNKAGLKGAYRTKWGWKSSLTVDGKNVYLGTFKTAPEAHKAFIDASVSLRGEFARGS